ncbi:DUF2251 domain-containing protein [Luteibacter aegosomatissinici]|uniref:DUF2251 domain-containing protein n=1 Tax=Luteibacter aegosomatissinici TaxID=2911539 RepID=UPI001FF7DB6B|nr:DUF2251 domain-containing protein [Luteibacter aegosomatissinici]UPG93780.1 DUF2251 domain-containing protein [Luteibacter aegosomatissinici]
MATNDIFEYRANSDGSLAGVYEHDDDAGYFYLYDLRRHEGQRIIGAVRVFVGPFRYDRHDLAIRWSGDERVVELIVNGMIRAAFDVSGQQEAAPSIPSN